MSEGGRGDGRIYLSEPLVLVREGRLEVQGAPLCEEID